MAGMENECAFSADRRYRYSLIHRINPLLGDNLILWIGLNPSTADEQQLDPTLTRIRSFSQREGFDGFWMANLFGLRTPYPKEMRADPEPVGAGNDAALLEAAARCDKIVAAWGAGGASKPGPVPSHACWPATNSGASAPRRTDSPATRFTWRGKPPWCAGRPRLDFAPGTKEIPDPSVRND